MEKPRPETGREFANMTMGGFLAELFLSRRPRAPDSKDRKECRWSRKLEHFLWRWLFAVSGSLTYCVGLWLWNNIRLGVLDPLVLYEFLFTWRGLSILAASSFFALILGLQDRGGGPLRLFIQGIALPALAFGVASMSGIFSIYAPTDPGQ